MFLDAEFEQADATTIVVKLNGRMTLGMRLREIESKMNHAVDGGVRRLVIDLRGIDYADSAGLGLIVPVVRSSFCFDCSATLNAPSRTLFQMSPVAGALDLAVGVDLP